MPRPKPALITWLDDGQAEVELVGGKAASLLALTRHGFRVPPGFCLTTPAFDEQVRSVPQAAETVNRLPDEDARRSLTESFERSPLAVGVAAALNDALLGLSARLEGVAASPVRYAVRSSGIGEDSSAASFAGLHETELDVTPEGVPDAVRRCWASLWSAPAVAYRQRRGLTHDGGGMAVVVQAMVRADAAAVVFTRHPVTRSTDQLVVTAIRGLGEAMVSGTVTPDTWIIDRASRVIAEYAPGDRAPGQAGAALETPVLDDLVAIALDVELSFGAPVDIEAAVASGLWYLLQARPITTS